MSLRDVRENVVIGQYDGYHYEPGVSPGSHTPTYAALRMYVDNWRWHGVPFYLRSGKGLSRKTTEMIIQFRSPPHMLFPVPDDVDIPGNTLSICVQPNEGMRLEFQSKVPDAELEMKPVSLEFHYHDGFAGVELPDAYERAPAGRAGRRRITVHPQRRDRTGVEHHRSHCPRPRYTGSPGAFPLPARHGRPAQRRGIATERQPALAAGMRGSGIRDLSAGQAGKQAGANDHSPLHCLFERRRSV